VCTVNFGFGFFCCLPTAAVYLKKVFKRNEIGGNGPVKGHTGGLLRTPVCQVNMHVM
jgi:hypothetical protein